VTAGVQEAEELSLTNSSSAIEGKCFYAVRSTMAQFQGGDVRRRELAMKPAARYIEFYVVVPAVLKILHQVLSSSTDAAVLNGRCTNHFFESEPARRVALGLRVDIEPRATW